MKFKVDIWAAIIRLGIGFVAGILFPLIMIWLLWKPGSPQLGANIWTLIVIAFVDGCLLIGKVYDLYQFSRSEMTTEGIWIYSGYKPPKFHQWSELEKSATGPSVDMYFKTGKVSIPTLWFLNGKEILKFILVDRFESTKPNLPTKEAGAAE